METCRHYEGCGAPLCPLDTKWLKTAIWYPDEPICKRRGLPDADWLKTQRRVAKRANGRDLFFTYYDLAKIKRVHPSIRGHNPDHYPRSALVRGGINLSGKAKNMIATKRDDGRTR
jgi:hypothetical protein